MRFSATEIQPIASLYGFDERVVEKVLHLLHLLNLLNVPLGFEGNGS